MKTVWARGRQLWPGRSIHMPLAPSYWAVLMAALGLLRPDHVLGAVAMLGLALAGSRPSRFLRAFYAFPMVGILYDATRFVRDLGVTPERVLNCSLRHFELAAFGFNLAGQRWTLQDYFFVHHSIAADLFFSVPYGIFLYLSAAYALYLFFTDERACARFCWVFFTLNAMGFVTYHLAPAAPPWYFHQYGCAVNLGARPSEAAALARVDAFLGIRYFHGFYGRASEIYGAIPSLHVAYPMLILLMGWRRHGWFGRAAAIAYFAWMSCAAVYLDHHWITDIVAGWIYCPVALYAVRKLLPERAAEASPAEATALLEPGGEAGAGFEETREP